MTRRSTGLDYCSRRNHLGPTEPTTGVRRRSGSDPRPLQRAACERGLSVGKSRGMWPQPRSVNPETAPSQPLRPGLCSEGLRRPRYCVPAARIGPLRRLRRGQPQARATTEAMSGQLRGCAGECSLGRGAPLFGRLTRGCLGHLGGLMSAGADVPSFRLVARCKGDFVIGTAARAVAHRSADNTGSTIAHKSDRLPGKCVLPVPAAQSLYD
jgi:hypothetical protein